MKIFKYQEVKAEDAGEGSCNVTVRWLIDKKLGAENFAMRLFEFKPGGHTPLHRHPWEHEIFVLEGEGVVVGEDGEYQISKGSVVFISANELHQFRNTGTDILRIICLIPYISE